MLEFAVSIEGLTEAGKATWVLEIDIAGERLLIAHEDKSLHWHPMTECRFEKLVPPGAPRPVVPLSPQGPQLVTPGRKAGQDRPRGLE